MKYVFWIFLAVVLQPFLWLALCVVVFFIPFWFFKWLIGEIFYLCFTKKYDSEDDKKPAGKETPIGRELVTSVLSGIFK